MSRAGQLLARSHAILVRIVGIVATSAKRIKTGAIPNTFWRAWAWYG
jgi:hypothetical protein